MTIHCHDRYSNARHFTDYFSEFVSSTIPTCQFLARAIDPTPFGEGSGNPLQYSCLENPMDGGAWWAAVHEVTGSRTQLSDFTFTFTHWRRKWQPTPVFQPGESPGWGSLVGYHLWGRTESDTTEATQQQQQQHRSLGLIGLLLGSPYPSRHLSQCSCVLGCLLTQRKTHTCCHVKLYKGGCSYGRPSLPALLFQAA